MCRAWIENCPRTSALLGLGLCYCCLAFVSDLDIATTLDRENDTTQLIDCDDRRESVTLAVRLRHRFPSPSYRPVRELVFPLGFTAGPDFPIPPRNV